MTWGSTTLKVVYGTWTPAAGSGGIVEIPLLPDPADLSAKSSVLQQMGARRDRVSATLLFRAQSEYDTLKADLNAGTARTLVGGTVNASYYIESLGRATRQSANQITAPIVWVEA